MWGKFGTKERWRAFWNMWYLWNGAVGGEPGGRVKKGGVENWGYIVYCNFEWVRNIEDMPSAVFHLMTISRIFWHLKPCNSCRIAEEVMDKAKAYHREWIGLGSERPDQKDFGAVGLDQVSQGLRTSVSWELGWEEWNDVDSIWQSAWHRSCSVTVTEVVQCHHWLWAWNQTSGFRSQLCYLLAV